MERHFELEIGELRGRILTMGYLAKRAIHLSMESLQNGSAKSAAEASEEVTDSIEPRINELHREIDQRVLDLIALQQIVAMDLRFVTAASRIGSDLERMSDKAVNIARRAISILTYPDPQSPMKIPKMAEAVEAMVRDSIGAFELRDVELARSILQRDLEVDQYRDVVFQELVDEMATAARLIQPALDLILISRNLERIADHATNIAESVVFMVLGEDIRHRYNVASGTQSPTV